MKFVGIATQIVQPARFLDLAIPDHFPFACADHVPGNRMFRQMQVVNPSEEGIAEDTKQRETTKTFAFTYQRPSFKDTTAYRCHELAGFFSTIGLRLCPCVVNFFIAVEPSK